MKRGLDKKGLNQIDWVISLAIFLLYIAWFFIFLKPQIQISSYLSPLGYDVKESFKNDFYYSIDKYPIFFASSKIQNDTPIFFDFNNKTGKNFDISGGKDYFLYKNRMLALQNFNNDTTYLWVVESDKTYTHTNKKLDLIKFNDTITTSKGLLARFNNSLLNHLSYNNNNIADIEFGINSYGFTPQTSNFTEYIILSEYKAKTQPITLFTRVIAKNSLIWFSAEKNDVDAANNLLMKYSVYGVTNYFSDNSHYGNISSCESYQNDFLKVYNQRFSMSFILPQNTSISFCKNSTVTRLNITMRINTQKDFFLILDTPLFKEENFTDYSIYSGVKQNIAGLDYSILSNETYTTYKTKKTEWGVSNDNNFQIIVWNSSLNNLLMRENNTVFILGDAPLTTRDVYSTEYRDFILNENGETSEVTVSVKTW